VNIENGLHSIDRTDPTRENQKSQRIGMDLQNVLSLLNNKWVCRRIWSCT
jgi:hypothetical protein